MSRKICKRKVYPLRNNVVARTIELAAITPQAQLNVMRLEELTHLEEFAKGTPTLADFKAIVMWINIVETMATSGVGPEALPACQKAERTCLTIKKRYETWNKLEATKAELQDLRELHEWFDLQRASIPRGDYEKMLDKTDNRLRSGYPTSKTLF